MRIEVVRPKILVSACLVGCCSRYDAAVLEITDDGLSRWMEKGLILPFCPETAGGLPTPRPPAEIAGGTGGDVLAGSAQVLNQRGEDVTENFITGARHAAAAVSLFDIRTALLKEGSPSCGITLIYDGSFSDKRVPGQGVAAARLAASKVALFAEGNLAGLEEWMRKEI